MARRFWIIFDGEAGIGRCLGAVPDPSAVESRGIHPIPPRSGALKEPVASAAWGALADRHPD